MELLVSRGISSVKLRWHVGIIRVGWLKLILRQAILVAEDINREIVHCPIIGHISVHPGKFMAG